MSFCIRIIIFFASFFFLSCSNSRPCIKWEPTPTGKQCINVRTYISICPLYSIGGVQGQIKVIFVSCTKTHCVKFEPCLRCIEWADRSVVFIEKPIPPEEACDE